MRTKTLLLIVMLLNAIAIWAAEKTWHVVTNKGEAVELSKVSYFLAASTETFDIVCSDGTTVSGVSGISFEPRESTGIQEVKPANDAMFSQIVDNQLTIINAKSGTTAQVLDLSGNSIIIQVLTDRHNVINVSQLQTGIYILRVDDNSIKFVKK